jgi:hypothetical protein
LHQAQMASSGDQSPTKRSMSVGPNSILGWDKLLVCCVWHILGVLSIWDKLAVVCVQAGNKQDNIMYTYVHNDSKTSEMDVSKTVTTSRSEGQNLLLQSIISRPKYSSIRQKVRC